MSQCTVQREHQCIGFAGGHDYKGWKGTAGKKHGLHSSRIVGTHEHTDRMEGTEQYYSDVLRLEEKCVW